jgi:hypothetical protein
MKKKKKKEKQSGFLLSGTTSRLVQKKVRQSGLEIHKTHKDRTFFSWDNKTSKKFNATGLPNSISQPFLFPIPL